MAIPFHLANLTKPQKHFSVCIDNMLPFEHRWLPKDGSRRPYHPAQAFDALDFAVAADPNPIITPPPSLNTTPFKFVEDVSDLGYLAAKLSEADEFAVDLEHNKYRSFQGLTCLMQISTRTEDFVVDTLKLRDHIGKFLRDVFMDPTKKKIIHGADNDVLWLQRDFGIYVVNLFDTMRASQVLKHERNSLEFLLKYYCGVTLNKEYQCSDWRIRPLPAEMVKYARDDTHFLLFIYDLMRTKLSSVDAVVEFGYDYPLGEVYKRSYEVCTKLYEIESFDKHTSYLYMYGLCEADLDERELSIVAALHEWRDRVAREEDESTGYVLPNKSILEIAKRKPCHKQELLQLVSYSKEYVIRDAALITQFISAAQVSNSHSSKLFKEAARLLKERVHPSQIAAVIQEINKSECRAQASICRPIMLRPIIYPNLIRQPHFACAPVAAAYPPPPGAYYQQPHVVYPYVSPYAHVNVNGPLVIH